jgi:branched-chain amino acid aminotransferase
VSFDKTQWAWHNGRIVPWAEATVHVSAPSVQYGAGIFEGIRCYETADGPAIFRLRAHLDRLYASAQHYDIEIPYERAELEEAICETIQRNAFQSCYIRPICYYGSGQPGLLAEDCPIHVTILTYPSIALLGADSVNTGVRVTVSKWRKFHSDMLPTTAKASGGYLNSMLAARDARCRGYDEALLLTVDGNISEGPTENLFVVWEGKLRTNDERSSILLGVTRDSVIEIARDLGYEVEVGSLKLEDLLAASEAFFTGTAAEVTPIREVDGTQIGTGKKCPVTASIQKKFFAATSGRDEKYRSWLHRVVPIASRH